MKRTDREKKNGTYSWFSLVVLLRGLASRLGDEPLVPLADLRAQSRDLVLLLLLRLLRLLLLLQQQRWRLVLRLSHQVLSTQDRASCPAS